MKFLKSPKFWKEKDSKISCALSPIAKLYGFITSVKVNRVTPEKSSVPVVCVGNVVLGGSGKTPTVELVCNILKNNSYIPHILTGGYGGYLKNVVKVDRSMHSYLQVGDEALLSASVAPTWVGKNRIKSAKAAVLSGANILVMDDGFQNNSLDKDFKILVVDSKQGFGNEYLFPAGPLRETVESGIKKSDVVLIVGEKNSDIEHRIKQFNSNIPIFYAKLEVVEQAAVANNRVIGFCGLGYPDKFKKTLVDCGYEVVDFIEFSDHHPYTITEIQKLIKASKAVNATLITTKKDFVKIPDVFKSEVSVVGIKLSLLDSEFETLLLEKLHKI